MGAEWDAHLQAIYWDVLEARLQFPGASLIRVKRDWREQNPPSGPAARLLRERLCRAGSILDVGAGNRYWQDVLTRMGIEARYESVDIETRYQHEHRDFLAVDGSYDAILMLELLEHLPLDVGIRFLHHAAVLLPPGGTLVIGTPNPSHAHSVWSSDFSHIRPWPAHDLWAACRALGFSDVDVFRQAFNNPRRALTWPLQRGLSKLLGIDPAEGLLAFARR